jgi:3-oxoacyl-[acyl-carrier protein] reductase
MIRALVTGGSGAIGTAICQELAQAGLAVIVHSHRRLHAAEAVAESIRSTGGTAQVIAFDVTDPEACGAALAELLRDGPIQVLVNNAGIHRDVPMPGMTVSQWREVIDVSLHGFFNVTQPLLLPMLGTRWGRIIVMSSLSATLGNRGQTNYAAAKAGLEGAAKSLALELAPRGITVNVVAPGIIATPMTGTIFPAERIERLVPMRRAGKPADIAHLVAFLASDRAGYISGQIIGVNGGIA